MEQLSSFKLRRFDQHVWIVCVGASNGVTLRGAEAEEAFELGAQLFRLASPDAPERVRALSVDLLRGRLLATIEEPGRSKPAAVRVDGDAVRDALDPLLISYLARAATARARP